jgi:hypothetical protein
MNQRVYDETLQACLAGGMTNDAAHEYATDKATRKEQTQPRTRQELFKAGFKLAGLTDDESARGEITRDYRNQGFEVAWTRNAVNGAWSYYIRRYSVETSKGTI